jgi:hypothetical protein
MRHVYASLCCITHNALAHCFFNHPAVTIESHDVFINPYMGVAQFSQPKRKQQQGRISGYERVGFANTLQQAAANGDRQALALIRADLNTRAAEVQFYGGPVGGKPDHSKQPWNADLEADVQHLEIVIELLNSGAHIDAATLATFETPLTLAVAMDNAAVVHMLCIMGADTELKRYVCDRVCCSTGTFGRRHSLIWMILDRPAKSLAIWCLHFKFTHQLFCCAGT